jgi:hypothetical protein
MAHPRTCTIEVYPTVKFRVAGLTDLESEQVHLQITFRYVPGRPAYTPRGEYAPIDPPDPPECDFLSAKLLDGNGLDPDQGTIEGWAMSYLDSDEGYFVACQAGEDEPDGPDPDEWLERKRDERQERF